MNVLQWHETIGRNVDPAGNSFLLEQSLAECLLEPGSHSGPSFAATYHSDPLDAAQIDWFFSNDQEVPVDVHVVEHESIRADGINARLPNAQSIFSPLLPSAWFIAVHEYLPREAYQASRFRAPR